MTNRPARYVFMMMVGRFYGCRRYWIHPSIIRRPVQSEFAGNRRNLPIVHQPPWYFWRISGRRLWFGSRRYSRAAVRHRSMRSGISCKPDYEYLVVLRRVSESYGFSQRQLLSDGVFLLYKQRCTCSRSFGVLYQSGQRRSLSVSADAYEYAGSVHAVLSSSHIWKPYAAGHRCADRMVVGHSRTVVGCIYADGDGFCDALGFRQYRGGCNLVWKHHRASGDRMAH